MITRFLHTALEVDDLDTAIKQYEILGFRLLLRFDKPEPKAVAAHLVGVDKNVIELWQFFDKTHPQVKYISRHIALESDDLDEDIKKLQSEGYEVVIPITSGVTKKYAFLSDDSGNYIEIASELL